MLKNYFLITLRSMMKNKLYIFINIFGMAISIASCIVAYFHYDFNKTFDHHHLHSSGIYRVNTTREFQSEVTTYGYVPMGLGNAIRENISDVNKVVRYSPSGANFRIKEDLFAGDIQYVDPEFFDIFTFEFLDGSAESLKEKGYILLSEQAALKYFNDVKVSGQPLTQLLDSGKVKEYLVGGVFRDQPINSSFGFEMAVTNYDNQFTLGNIDYHENSWKYRNTLFLQIKDPSRVQAVKSQIQTYVENNNKVREDFIIKQFELDPFVGMGVRDSYQNRPGTWTNEGSPISAVVGLSMMGILILLLACFNLTNTSISISSGRLKEIGVRKVMGSERKHLIAQFLGETIFVCFIALIIGVFLAEVFLIPTFNMMWEGIKIETNYFGNLDFTFFLVGLLLIVGILAGAYPAFYISKFQSVSILKGTVKFGGTNPFMRTLLTLQFAISLIGIVCSMAFIDNARYQQEFDLGFDQRGVVYSFVENRSEYETYRNQLLKNPDIHSVSGSEHHFFASSYNDPIKSSEKEIEVDILNVGDDYVKTVGLTLLNGRDFIKDSETDRKESVLVSEELVTKFGWNEPLGKEIIWMDTVRLFVIGVVKNVYSRGLWEKVEPTMIRYGKPDPIRYIQVSAGANQIVQINEFMESTWKELFPNKMYTGKYMDEEIVEANTVNNNIVKMFMFLGLVAVFLSATGLFTMVSLNIIRRMKEIGVRKVLGASIANITRIINREFAIILIIACVLGGFAGAYMAEMLMGSIWDYFQKTTIQTLLISAFIMIFVSAGSIGFKTYNTARMNPTKTLRDE